MKGSPYRIRQLVISVLIWLLPVVVMAAPAVRNYQVNVIVFRYNHEQAISPERYYPPLNLDSKGVRLAPITQSADQTAYPSMTLQPFTDFDLKNPLLALFKDSRYDVLLAFSWWQPFTYEGDPTVINILGGDKSTKLGTPVLPDNLLRLQNQEALEQLRWQIKGTLSISLHRYFELNLQLQYTENLQNTLTLSRKADFTPYYTFEINQAIRAKSKKIYFFDNPRFGVILEMLPYTPPTTMETENPTEQSVTKQEE